MQLSQYHNSIASSNFMQQKWAAQLQTHYNSVSKNGGIDSASVLNYAHSLFPHLHAALGSKYQHLPPPQHQFMLTSTSLPLSSMKQRHNLPLGFERNGGGLNPASMAQLQLSCNQHLWMDKRVYYCQLYLQSFTIRSLFLSPHPHVLVRSFIH